MKKLIIPAFVAFLLTACGGEDTEATTENESGSDNSVEEAIEQEIVIDISLNKIDEVPSECTYEYNMVDAHSWSDKNGTNYFIRTISEIDETQDEYGPTGSQYLFAYHWVENTKGEFTLMREITDFVKDCEFDLNMSHELDAITVTDIDEDEVGEVTFIYRMTCTSDVSPSTQKLIMLTDGNKFALRGTTKALGSGGEYEPGPEFEGTDFMPHCVELWEANVVEYDFDL